jgi:purine nucleoside phosphorylase
VILILGGTAAYFLPLEELLGPLRRVDLETPYGAAFPIFVLERYGERIAFASRHGLGRLEVSPPFVNARANIWAAHALGVRRIISWNGVGAINPLLEVHDLLALDGLLDFTKTRARGFDDRPPTTDHRPGSGVSARHLCLRRGAAPGDSGRDTRLPARWRRRSGNDTSPRGLPGARAGHCLRFAGIRD